MKNYTSTLLEYPTAHITKQKHRIKQFGDTVYLQNGDEFEIELFNPTSNKILCEIEVNNTPIGNGIVLRPGERVFLERFIDTPKKFIFETYTVNGNNNVVQNAIKDNGNVIVKFFKEVINFNVGHSFTTNIDFYNPYNPTMTRVGGYVSPTYTNDLTFITNSASNFDTSMEYKSKIETGRVEKGSNSNQTFIYDTTKFEQVYFWISQWKILPSSQKQIYKENIVLYCHECGSRRKKDTHKFCPNCGTKF